MLSFDRLRVLVNLTLGDTNTIWRGGDVGMISKAPDPTMGLFDGFDPKAAYQMVPLAGLRVGFKVATGDEAVDVRFDPPGMATFGGRRTFTPPSRTPINDNSMRLEPKMVATFDVFGTSPGQTLLVVSRVSDGKILESFTFSVKAPLPKSYSVCLVHDRIRRSPWLPRHDPTSASPPPAPDSVVKPLMEAVKKCFLQQTNVVLSDATGVLHDLTLHDIDLGDPIVLDKRIVVAGQPSTIASVLIVSRSPRVLFSATFVIYLCWSIRDIKSDFVGQNSGAVNFIEFNAHSQSENALTIAHELGHAMGLGHNGRDVLMAGDGISRSSLLHQFEIDTVNTSGTLP